MMKLFPSDVGDTRRTLWFEDIYADDGTFMFLKYAHNRYASGEEDRNPDNTFLIFRYAGAILLRAEALAELGRNRSEEHTSELQSLMRISYAVFCLKNKTTDDTL